MEKKEVQKQIVEKNIKNEKATEEEFFNVLRIVAPGTNLRAALDGALKTGKGALILTENNLTSALFEGGFRINARFTPQKLVELAKMDGAIILSNDMKRISYANVLLTPDSKIPTHETGTRHKAAERTARQAGTLAIAISERKNEITLYYKNIRYPLVQTDELLRKSNENIQLLEKQRDLFDKQVAKLDAHEIKSSPNLKQAINVIQKGRVILKITEDLTKSLIELGREGALLRMWLREMITGVEKETEFVIKDYTKLDVKRTKFLLGEMSYDSVLDEESIVKILGYETIASPTSARGWRILSRTSLSDSEIAKLFKEIPTIREILSSSQEVYSNSLGTEKAEILKEELKKIRSVI